MTGSASWNDATRAQITAARPDASTWLGANAGSGKTRVLTDRVARLLLDGVSPQHILCLTYTKAAASEMQNRLFERLGGWAMLDDDALRAALAQLGVAQEVAPSRLRLARTLFAQAIETPGGLKIQTIHSFCASLLRRFPLEAGVSPQFTEIEDRAADLLRAEIVDRMADGPDRPLVDALARHYTGEDFGKLTRQIVVHREGFAPPRTPAQIMAAFGLAPNATDETLLRGVFLGNETTLLATIIPPMLEKGGQDASAAEKLQAIKTLDLSALPILENTLLFGSGAKAPFAAKIGSFPTKPTRSLLAAVMPDLEALMLRVEQARHQRLALMAARRSFALHAFAHRFLSLYETEKENRGWLDFDDLILRARALLSESRSAAWVLYRIDGGIDHILVDEAQDTNPRQWDVIERLTEEFSAGAGTRTNQDRTLFVVGDKKQSIYSFQGADPREFDRKKLLFQEKLEGAGLEFQSRSLDFSFRSSSAILNVVDRTFDPTLNAGLQEQSLHRAFKEKLPGRVDLWPIVAPIEASEDNQHWSTPLDRQSPRHHNAVLASKIAETIRTLVEHEHYIPEDDGNGGFVRRRITAGDFLILVQRRSDLFSHIIRACKAAGLPIAGADRLKVGAELAVRDLGALLSFLATPEDSLSLATALRSPLFGWSEQALFTLAQGRNESFLWQTLRNQTDRHPKTVAMLRDLRAHVDFLRPFDLIERILTLHDGRRRLLARLGPEAEDGINALLDQALAYERNAVPSLTGFLIWMETDELEIKRQIDSASDQIRVMTVHGAKGLEAPIVILPDTAQRKPPTAGDILELDDLPIWKPLSDDMPTPVVAEVDAYKAAQEEERLRLLYVAMTRAEKWLIVAAAGKFSDNGDSWYQMVDRALRSMGATEGPDGLRHAEHDWDALPIAEKPRAQAETVQLEPHFSQRIAPVAPRIATLSPSDLGGEKVMAITESFAHEAALDYGTLVHLVLENAGSASLESLLATHAAAFPPELVDLARRELAAVLASPVMQAEALTEVSVTADLAGRRIHGAIDRLVVSDSIVLAIDYKTNRVVPETPQDAPEGLKRQLGAYAHALAAIYPDREIQTAILWTVTGDLMVFPHDIVTSALMRSPYLDVPGAAS